MTLARAGWDPALWLQHHADATELDAEITFEATGHLFCMFAPTVRRYQQGSSRRCPSCDPYRLGQDGDVEEHDELLGYSSHEVCLACGWTLESTFEPYAAEWLERTAEYLEGDAQDLSSIGTGKPLGATGHVVSTAANGSELDLYYSQRTPEPLDVIPWPVASFGCPVQLTIVTPSRGPLEGLDDCHEVSAAKLAERELQSRRSSTRKRPVRITDGEPRPAPCHSRTTTSPTPSR